MRILLLKTKRQLWEMRRRRVGPAWCRLGGRQVVCRISVVDRYIEAQGVTPVSPHAPKAIGQKLHAVGLEATRAPMKTVLIVSTQPKPRTPKRRKVRR